MEVNGNQNGLVINILQKYLEEIKCVEASFNLAI